MAFRFRQENQDHILLTKEEMIAMEESEFRQGRPLSDQERKIVPEQAELVVDPGKEEITAFYLSQIGINIFDITNPNDKSWNN